LSLVMSLSCALLATSLHQWARRYLRLAQPARCGPEKRARMRAFFADGVDKMHIPLAVEGLPMLLHLSLFLFFGGLVIFLFNIDHEVFVSVVWWIGLFSMMYGLITLLPLIRHDSPYNTPLSTPAWSLYASMLYVTIRVQYFIKPFNYGFGASNRYDKMRRRLRGWMLGGVEKAAEGTASERSSEIDIRIFDWTIKALGNDDTLEKYFEAIPGFFNSRLVKIEKDIPWRLLEISSGHHLRGYHEHDTRSSLLRGLDGRQSPLPSSSSTSIHREGAGYGTMVYSYSLLWNSKDHSCQKSCENTGTR
jgi:hypothetical protein